MIGSGIALAQIEASSLPLQGPIPFEVFDLDGSGGISEQEFDEVHGRRAEVRGKAGLPALSKSRPFSSLDSDGDGEITPAELEAVRGAAGLGPGRGPGMRGGRGSGRGGSPPTFSEFDLNGDGVVGEQEFIDARTARIAKRVREGRMMRGLIHARTFSDLDIDGDGSLTPEEFAAVVQSHRQGMGRSAPAGVDP
ncbi:EF-hand domain-containing protein [bacterium]|nr:EF-hand domain-containing protein [bacterium]